jgi:hypothetical protein
MKSKKPPVPEFPKGVFEHIRVDDLQLDVRNPRLVEYGISPKEKPEKVLEILWDKMAVDEVAMSIAASGYWEYEPLFVVREGEQNVVIEGNRRLAAVIVLRDRSLQTKLGISDLPPITEERRHALEYLPVIRVEPREDVWRYLGFKHVNGPAKWRTYARACFIRALHRQQHESIEHIALQFGDRAATTRALYEALRAFDLLTEQSQSKQLTRNSERFMVVVNALKHDSLVEYLGLRVRRSSKRQNQCICRSRRRELSTWLFGKANRQQPCLVTTDPEDLRKLATIVESGRGLKCLRQQHDLSAAFATARGCEQALQDLLRTAGTALKTARRLIDTDRSRRSATSYRIVCSLQDQARALAQAMYGAEADKAP